MENNNKVIFVKKADVSKSEEETVDNFLNLVKDYAHKDLELCRNAIEKIQFDKENKNASYEAIKPVQVSRNLKKIKEENDTKKLANIANQKNHYNNDLESIDPIYKLKKLEAEFFSAKQELNKNIRLVENLKSKMYKTYQEMFPDLSIEEIKAKFTY